jgi:hypothetical protein
MSEIMMGHPVSDVTRERISVAKTGVPLSEEHKQHLSDAKIGYVPWNTGLHWDEEFKSKRSKDYMGKFYGKYKNSSSKYFGVHYHGQSNRWVAEVKYKGEKFYLGIYPVEEDAARAYNVWVMNTIGDESRLNHIP